MYHFRWQENDSYCEASELWKDTAYQHHTLYPPPIFANGWFRICLKDSLVTVDHRYWIFFCMGAEESGPNKPSKYAVLVKKSIVYNLSAGIPLDLDPIVEHGEKDNRLTVTPTFPQVILFHPATSTNLSQPITW